MNAEDLLAREVLRKRSIYNDRLIVQQQQNDVTQSPVTYAGYDVNTGLHLVQPIGGRPIPVGRLITNGSIAKGQPVQLVRHQGKLIATIDEVPTGWRSLTNGGGGNGTGGSGISGLGFGDNSGDPDEENPFCGYKLMNGNCEAQTECVEGDSSIYPTMEACVAAMSGGTCDDVTFQMNQQINYTVDSGRAVLSATLVSGSWSSGTQTGLTCPTLFINSDRTTLSADFDTDYSNNSGECTYSICTKDQTQGKNWGCVEEAGSNEARCAYFPDGSGSYASLDECEAAISPSFTGGQCDAVPYHITGTTTFSYNGNLGVDNNNFYVWGPITSITPTIVPAPEPNKVYRGLNAACRGLYRIGNTYYPISEPTTVFLGFGEGFVDQNITPQSTSPVLTRTDGQPDNCGNPPKKCSV